MRFAQVKEERPKGAGDTEQKAYTAPVAGDRKDRRTMKWFLATIRA